MVAIEGFWQESVKVSVLNIALAVILGVVEERRLETAGKLAGDWSKQFK